MQQQQQKIQANTASETIENLKKVKEYIEDYCKGFTEKNAEYQKKTIENILTECKDSKSFDKYKELAVKIVRKEIKNEENRKTVNREILLLLNEQKKAYQIKEIGNYMREGLSDTLLKDCSSPFICDDYQAYLSNNEFMGVYKDAGSDQKIQAIKEKIGKKKVFFEHENQIEKMKEIAESVNETINILISPQIKEIKKFLSLKQKGNPPSETEIDEKIQECVQLQMEVTAQDLAIKQAYEQVEKKAIKNDSEYSKKIQEQQVNKASIEAILAENFQKIIQLQTKLEIAKYEKNVASFLIKPNVKKGELIQKGINSHLSVIEKNLNKVKDKFRPTHALNAEDQPVMNELLEQKKIWENLDKKVFISLLKENVGILQSKKDNIKESQEILNKILAIVDNKINFYQDSDDSIKDSLQKIKKELEKASKILTDIAEPDKNGTKCAEQTEAYEKKVNIFLLIILSIINYFRSNEDSKPVIPVKEQNTATYTKALTSLTETDKEKINKSFKAISQKVKHASKEITEDGERQQRRKSLPAQGMSAIKEEDNRPRRKSLEGQQGGGNTKEEEKNYVVLDRKSPSY